MQNIDEYRDRKGFKNVSNMLFHELKNENEFQTQQNKSNIEKEKATDENDLNLLPIDTRRGQYLQTHLDNNKADSVNEELTAQEPEFITSTTEFTISKTRKGNIQRSLSNDTYIFNSEDDEDDEDILFSFELNEVNNDTTKEAETDKKTNDSEKTNELIKNNKEKELSESVSIEYIDKSLNLNIIKKHPELRNSMKINDSINSRFLLMESHRICYACVSSSDASCLKPNRKTTVKYCHKDNKACVAKSYTIGRK
ncbi:hypothetical protein RR46_05613 [Papilio xuthus]|uniref:Uncharacterized protein n=1 Tax=Papilio xuthus TaxID=66420 RepID=A0A194PUA9_PAPXU|nr:hypothetical protein RR46_05613 [Papilio xuthus]